MAKQPFIPGANVAELTAEYGFGSDVMANVLHFHSSTPWTSASLTALCNNYIGWELATGKAQRSHQLGLILVKARDLTTQFSAVAESSDTLPINGAINDNALPLNVTAAISLRTGLAGRSFRGRVYFLGLCMGETLNCLITPTRVAAMVAAYNGLITAANSWSTPIGVFSRRSAGAWRLTGGVFTPAVNFKCDGQVKTQRRRLP